MNKNDMKLETQSGNAVVIVLVALVVVAVGALAYLSGQMAGEQRTPVSEQAVEIAQEAEKAIDAVADVAEAPTEDSAPKEFVVKPGNPVVAKIGEAEIMRNDVIAFVQTLPQETQQLPPQQLFPLALEQVINARLVAQKSKSANVSNDEAYKKQLEVAKEQITQRVYVENQVKARITDDRLKSAYNEYVSKFPEIDEVKAAHILMEDEAAAKAVLKQVKDGGDFVALAKENSIDRTAENGGDLGYFMQADVVPPFGEAAFTTEPGNLHPELVKSDFGFHIIKVEDKRKRKPVDYDTAKPLLETQLRQIALQEVLGDWAEELKVERFDVNGEPLAPTSGDAG